VQVLAETGPDELNLIEGHIDLMFRDGDGLVVAHFKTDAAVTQEPQRAYATQLSAYARAISDAAGELVRRMTLHLLRPNEAGKQELLVT